MHWAIKYTLGGTHLHVLLLVCWYLGVGGVARLGAVIGGMACWDGEEGF